MLQHNYYTNIRKVLITIEKYLVSLTQQKWAI